MRHLFLIPALLTVLLLSARAETPVARPTGDPQAVVAALNDLDAWFAGDSDPSNCQRWKSFLQTDTLRQELAKGSAANPQTVTAIANIYRSNVPGLGSTRFVAVRDALNSYLSPAAAPTDIPSLLQQLKGKYEPPTAAELNTAKQNIRAKLATLNVLLARTPGNVAGWRAFLGLDALDKELNAPTANLDAIKATQTQFDSAAEGLEMEPFEDVRNALSAYSQLLTEAANANAAQRHDQLLDQLAATLNAQANSADLNPEQLYTISQSLFALRSPSVAPLARAIEQRFPAPNFYANISAEVLGNSVNRAIDEVSPVTDNILGTSIQGTAHTVGTAQMRLIPCADYALMQTVLRATAYSDTVGYHHPVTICSTGTTTLLGVKSSRMDNNGIAAWCATAQAQTCTSINGITANTRHLQGVIERAAWKRAGQSKSSAEAIASQHAEQKLVQRMEEQAGPMIAKNNANFQKNLKEPATRYGTTPRTIHYSTSEQYMSVVGQMAAPRQISVATKPPLIANGKAMNVQVHETAVNNYLLKRYGGQVLTKAAANRDALAMSNKSIDQITKDSGDDADDDTPGKWVWAMTFDPIEPVVIHFTGGSSKEPASADNLGGFTVKIRCLSFARGVDKINPNDKENQLGPVDIEATYKFQPVGPDGQFVAKRQGNLKMTPRDRKLEPAEARIQRTLFGRFNRTILKETLTSDGLKLPNQAEDAPKLPWSAVSATSDGWFAAIWDSAPVPTAPPAKAAVQAAE